MEWPSGIADWEAAIALQRKYLAWCKAILNDGWDLFALNSANFVGNGEYL